MAHITLQKACRRFVDHVGSRHIAGNARAYDIIVIGGGVVGNSSALELRRKGFTTVNVDAGPCPGYGSTSSSSAIVRNYYSSIDSCRLAWEGYHGWVRWADYLQAPPNEDLCYLNEIGNAAIDTPASPQCQKYLANVRKAMAACGIPVEDWDTAELQKRIPYMTTASFFPPRKANDDEFGAENGGSIAGALFCQHAGYVNDPQLAARNLADAVIRAGGAFRWNSKVTQVLHDPTGTRVCGVRLSDGSSIEAPIVINAAGPHSRAFHELAFKDAKVADDSNISSRPLKVEVAYVREPPGSIMDKTFPVVVDLDVGVYMRPQQGGQLLIGSVEPECDELEFLSAPEDLKEGLTDEWTNLVYRAALRLPGLQVPNTAAGLAALYDTTPDWVPIYDRSALGGFYSMRGTSGNQFKNAPVVGRICAHLVDGCENGYSHDAEPFKLPLTYTSGVLDLGLFSRLRSLEDTSGSVLG